MILVPADRATIQAAVDAATAGARILVAPGTYAEAVVIVGAKDGLTIEALDPATPPRIQGTLNASLDGVRVDSVDRVTLRRLRIVGTYNGVRLNYTNDSLLEALDVEDSALAIRVNNGARATIRDCTIEGTRVEGGIDLSYAEDSIVTGNQVSATSREGIRVLNAPDTVVTHNTVTGSTGASGIKTDQSSGVTVSDNVATDHYLHGIQVGNATNVTFVGNDARSNRSLGIRLENAGPFTTITQVTAAGNTASGNLGGDILVIP